LRVKNRKDRKTDLKQREEEKFPLEKRGVVIPLVSIRLVDKETAERSRARRETG